MEDLLTRLVYQRRDGSKSTGLWSIPNLMGALKEANEGASQRTIERKIKELALLPEPIKLDQVTDELGRGLKTIVRRGLEETASRKRQPVLSLQIATNDIGHVYFVNDGRSGRKWLAFEGDPSARTLHEFLIQLSQVYPKSLLLWPHGTAVSLSRELVSTNKTQDVELPNGRKVTFPLTAYQQPETHVTPTKNTSRQVENNMEMTHLDRLEAESIHIIREVMAEAENPVMLYSIGKDSSVMLRLAEKAFYPSRPPFPLLHVDTRWKFQAMYAFRDRVAEESGMDLIVHINPEGVEKNINPFDHGSALHTDVMKTQSLKMALDKFQFDVAFGGARRDEEKSRAKERVFSFRTASHRWDPKNQRPELWELYNGRKSKGESIRVFPLSNWTELDIWQYIYREEIPIVPLYYAAERPVVERDGMLMMVDDDRLKLFAGETIHHKRVRFRTLGCYPLTGAIESDADDLQKILLELLEARTSERQGRAIDSDSSGSMEKKKQEGYF